MESADVSNNKIFSPSSLAASNRLRKGLSELSISIFKRSDEFEPLSNDVSDHQSASHFLEKDQYDHRLQQHTHQSTFHFHDRSVEDDVSLESVSFNIPWSELIFPGFVILITVLGVFAVGVLLLLWFKNNLTKHKRIPTVPADKLEQVKQLVRMSEYDVSQSEEDYTTVRSSSALAEAPKSQSDEPSGSLESLSSKSINRDGTSPTPDRKIHKTNTSDNLSVAYSPHSLRRAHAKTSLNNVSIVSTSPSAMSSPSPTIKSAGKKFSFSQTSFYEQQQHFKSKFGTNTDEHEDSKTECPISKISVLKGDVCCVQPPQQYSESPLFDSGRVPGSSSKTLVDSYGVKPKLASDNFCSPFSDDKENMMKCTPISDHVSSRNVKSLRGTHSFAGVDSSDIQMLSNRKVLTQSPIFFGSDQNSPNIYDSSSSPTLIPSLTPSSISSATTTHTTPNTAMHSCSSASSLNRFTFSPKVINELSHQESPHTAANHPTSANGKFGNSYFRFPEVDTFTPPTSAQTANSSNKGAVFKIPSLVTSWIPSLDTPSSEQTASNVTDSLPDRTDRLTGSKEEVITNDQLDVVDSNECRTTIHDVQNISIPDNIASSSRATRRVRLKSISLDSEGARLVEENLTTSIPVEELVEIAANQPHHSVSDNQFQTTMQSQMIDTIDEHNCRKQRNIFNLTLNLNDKDESLTVDDDYKFNEFYFEYYDYDDEEDEEYDMECGGRKSQHSQIQTPRTPTITQTRKKASSLDSDQSLNYLLPQPVRTQSAMEKVEHRSSSRNVVHHSTSLNTHTSSLSVPTTPKRQPYRLQQQQQHVKFKQNRFIGDSVNTINNSPASERHLLCGFQQRLGSFEENTDNANVNADEHKYMGGSKGNLSNLTLLKDHTLSVSNANLKTLPEITPVCEFAEPSNEPAVVEKPPTQTLNKSRSSILQRRGSNHSLVLNLEAASGDSGLTKGLSTSNYSLSNYKGSHLSLAGSSYNLQQHQSHHQGLNKPSGQTVQVKKNLLQRRGSNTSLILNLQGSSNSLNRYNSHSSLNMHNQQNIRPAKKGLLERRNSNTSLTLINVQNRALSVSNCNLPGSICSLNSMATYQTQNDGLMLEEEEHQLAVNNGQSKCREHTTSCSGNEPHLSPNCQQHGGRRKFLSSDSLHNIASTRASCCCKQKETSIDNTNICYHQGQINNDSIDDYKPNQASRSTECSCTTNRTGKGSEKLGIATNDIFKYKSTVTSTASTNNLTQFTCCDCCCCNCADALAGGVNTMSISNTNVRKITTKPLSPQTTSEDFKIYLANIQFLQNASNVLSATYMKNLHAIFKKSYGCYDKNRDDNVLSGANNDVKLTNLSIIPDVSKSKSIDDQYITRERSGNEEELISEEMQKKMTLKIHQEFWDLPSNYQEKPLVFGSQSKNRYKTILPNEHSRVILQIEPGMSAEPYINANFIKGPDYTNNSYIATQGPMVNTIYEFWLMIHQNVMKSAAHNISKLCSVEQKIIMLTDFVENNRQKCSVYFPLEVNESVVFSNVTNINVDTVLSSTDVISTELRDSSEPSICKAADSDINFNYFLITNVAICRKNGYTMRELFVVHSYQNPAEQQEIRIAYTVHHYWFPDWPDHRSPEDIDVLLDMSLDILDNNCYQDFNKSGNEDRIRALPVIHCSAGIGRTGCLLAILNGLSQIRSSLNSSKSPCVDDGKDASGDHTKFPLVPTENQTLASQSTNGEQASVDVLGIVCNLRLQRGGMVQNSEQYELIHRALCLYMQKHNLQK